MGGVQMGGVLLVISNTSQNWYELVCELIIDMGNSEWYFQCS